jgi:transcription antitermination protein NusB
MVVQGRRCSRRLAMQALYQFQLSNHSHEELLEQFKLHPDYAVADGDYFQKLLELVMSNITSLDENIDKHGNIFCAQLDPVEHAILWIATAELRCQEDVPMKVVLNEAIDLAKEFGAEGGYRFVNGVLDKLASQLRPNGN